MIEHPSNRTDSETKDTQALLEWPVLFGHLLDECLTPYGVQSWQAQPFLEDVAAIRQHQSEVQGLKILIMRYGDVTSDTNLPDTGPVVRRLLKGGLLNLNELRQVIKTLQQGGRLLRHFARSLRSEPQYDTVLAPLLDEEVIPQEVVDYLLTFMEPEGELRDSASPELARLRHRMRSQKHAMQQKIQSYLHNPDLAQVFQSPTVTEREGRSVFPVKVEHKSKLPGVIHGASGTGSTIFVEPQGLVVINNELQAVLAELDQEIERIVRELSRYLEGHAPALEAFLMALGALDRRLAAARLSRVLDGNPVDVAEEAQIIDLKKARHPLLVINMAAASGSRFGARSVVANDMRLGLDGIRTLVITGPNTGGKTVMLKTVGLFALMLRAGLHLPVEEDSRMSCFEAVLADIGDQQSIAQNLSTFSAHIQRLKSFVADESDLSRGLVLIDEIAAGTDPAEGAALAKAILDELHVKGALTVVTTHLGELKLDAHQHPGFMNASVEFDAETLSPTYRLMLGVPGASNAITIAQKLGLKEPVITRARANLSAPVRESAELLQELEQKNRQLEEELQSARSFRLEAQEAYEKVALERQKLEDEKRQALKQFQQSLKSRIHGLEEQVKQLRKELQQPETANLDRIGHKLKNAGRKADHVFGEAREKVSEAPRLQLSDLKPGDVVFSRQLEITGEITAINVESKEVTLQSGIMRVTVPVADLQRPYEPKKRTQQGPATKKLDRPHKAVEGPSVLEEPRDPSLSCDVRGQRADEALQHVEKFLDDALVSGYHTVAVIHGMGTGALKREIRSYLAASGYVRRFYPAQATQGGDGKTIIELSG